MVTVNIFGDCVCRDSCTPLVNSGEVNVLQYPGHSSMIAMFSPKISEDIEFNYDTTQIPLSNFRVRQIRHDYNKIYFDYLFAKKSDYVLVSFSNNRHGLFVKGDGKITDFYLKKTLTEEQQKYLEIDKCRYVSAYDDIPIEDHYASIDKSIEKLLSVYEGHQLIYIKHFAVKSGKTSKGTISSFSTSAAEECEKFNKLEEKLCAYFISKVPNCHVIEFPKSTIGDYNHQFGAGILHYVPEYYEYVAKALRIIFKGLPIEEEKERLQELYEIYEVVLKQLKDNCALISYKINNVRLKTAASMLENMISDIYNEGKFDRFLDDISAKNKTLAVLSFDSFAGRAVLTAAKSKSIQVIYQSNCSSVNKLTDEEWEKCRKADVIILANVHSAVANTRDGITEINIQQLLK